MAVETKKISGRRSVRYASYDDLLADAQRLAHVPVQALGNWTQGQIYSHLAMSFDSSIDGMDFALPAPVRVVFSMFMKKRFLSKPIPPGFKTVDRYVPQETSVAAALESLQKAIARLQQISDRARHPAFGNIGRHEWDAFNLRHAELHMSFLVESQNGKGS